MSDRIIQGFSEMKNIYLTQILTEEKNEEEDYGEKFEGKYKKAGKKSKDYDGDGEVEDEADEYAGVKDKAIDKAMDEKEEKSSKKSKKKSKEKEEMDESFSNWRQDLYEVISKLEKEPKVRDIDNETVTEKAVNNKVVINPPVTEKFQHIFTQELDEEFIIETADVAADYFVSQGLNEHGLELVVEELGLDKFIDYVFCIAEETLLTEATKRTPAELKALEARRKQLKSESKAKHEEAKASIARRVSQSKGDEAVKKATAEQPKTRTKAQVTKDNIARGILGLISGAQKQYQQGMERHRAATTAATQIAQTAGKAASVVGKGAKEFGSNVSSGFRMATGLETPSGKETKLGRTVAATGLRATRRAAAATRDAAARGVAERRARSQANESVQYILEKATSEQQQKIFGLALSVKRGDTPRSEVSDQVLKIVDEMSTAEIRKFAGTKHKGLPHRKEQ